MNPLHFATVIQPWILNTTSPGAGARSSTAADGDQTRGAGDKGKGAEAVLPRPKYATISVAFSQSDGETNDTEHNKRDEQERR